MKKIMLIIAVVALSISASAQTKYWDSSEVNPKVWTD